MKYITAEQFLKEDKKVQETILDWWKPETGDLIYRNTVHCVIYGWRSVIRCVDLDLCSSDCTFNKTEAIPLLTEGQLREFIEDKFGEFNVKHTDEGILLCSNCKILSNLDNLQQNLLQALWQVACNLIERECL